MDSETKSELNEWWRGEEEDRWSELEALIDRALTRREIRTRRECAAICEGVAATTVYFQAPIGARACRDAIEATIPRAAPVEPHRRSRGAGRLTEKATHE